MAESGCAVQATCGGCPLLPLDRRSELETKLRSVSAQLSARGIDADVRHYPVLNPGRAIAARSRYGYRNRLRMKVVDGRVEFFNRVKHNGCPVVRPDLWEGIQQLLEAAARHPELLKGVAHVEVRVGDDGELGLVTSVPVDQSPLEEELGLNWVVAHRGMVEAPTLRYLLADGISIDMPITSFVQVNSSVNRQLVHKVLAVAHDVSARSFVDLFCGAGNFAIPLAEHGLVGAAVDNAGAAMAALARSKPAQAGSIRCIEGDARTLLSELSPADLVVADPPRAGLQKSHSHLADLVSGTLVLIGCKTSAFAADVATLRNLGLRLDAVTVFDMFPGTRHAETVAVLRR